MPVGEESEEPREPMTGGASTDPHIVPMADDSDGTEAEEVVIRLNGSHAVVFAASTETKPSRWGRWLAQPTARELRSLLKNLDPITRAFIETKRLTGSLVELHPVDREMFKAGFKAISEDGGWLQANFRDRGQFTRLMRIRPATGVAVMSGGALTLAALAAQGQAAEMARDVEKIGQRLNQLYAHVQDDQIGAVESVVEQVYDLVDLFREHGDDGVRESDVSVVRNALSNASHRCMRHLKTAVKNLEEADQDSAREAIGILNKGSADEVMLYLDLLKALDMATVQFGLAQIAFDCHAGRLDVAKARAQQVTRSVDKIRREIGGACRQLSQFDEDVRAHLLPLWRRARKEIGASVRKGTIVGATGGAALAVGPVAAEAVNNGNVDGSSSNIGGKQIGGLAAVGTAVGFAGGVFDGTRKTILEVRAKDALEGRLEQLALARVQSARPPNESTAVLEWLHALME